MSHNDHEPMPVRPAGGRSIWDMVIEDMRGRDEFGAAKYGGPLVANDGRRSLVDAYQEALDLAVYLKKAIVEAERSALQSDDPTCLFCQQPIQLATHPECIDPTTVALMRAVTRIPGDKHFTVGIYPNDPILIEHLEISKRREANREFRRAVKEDIRLANEPGEGKKA